MFFVNLLDSNYNKLKVLDAFASLIWTDRYWAHGDFEVTLPAAMPTELLGFINQTKYLSFPYSNSLMILDDTRIKSDPEDGDLFIIKGNTLPKVLDRRIVWDQTVLSGNLQDEVERLLYENVISPADPDRIIPNFTFLPSTDPAITALVIDSQFMGEELDVVISDICRSNNIGYRVERQLNGDWQFELYAGVDRSKNQSVNQHVIFRPSLENLLNAEYLETNSLLKTGALVAGSAGIGNVRRTISVPSPDGWGAGLDRREKFVSASISRNTADGELTDEEYDAQLIGKGLEALATCPYIRAFDGQVSTDMYAFGTHYYMGDILQIADNYGHSSESRVTEMIYSQDKASVMMYPTFTTVD